MSPLPEHKKTPEEIAALRGRLGIPGSEKPVAAPRKVDDDRRFAPPGTSSATASPVEKPVAPVIPPPAADDASERRPPAVADEIKESELDPVTGLPVRRRSERELAALRRRGMIETQEEAMRLPVRRAHNLWVVSGYLLLFAAVWPVHEQMWFVIPLSLMVGAAVFGGFFFFLRPYSKHHGAFILVGVFLLLMYAVLQFFTNLRHAT